MSLESIREKALELKKLRDKKNTLNDELSEVSRQIKDLEESQIDKEMDDLGLSDVTINGVQVKRGVIFRGNITTSTNKNDFQFLFDTENEGALKQMILIDISTIKASYVQGILDEHFIPYEIKYTIHHATLSSILKDLVENGKLSTEDFDKFRIYAQPQIKVKVDEKKEEDNND